MENATTGQRSRCNEAYYTFVAVDPVGSHCGAGIKPETEAEQRRFDGACVAAN